MSTKQQVLEYHQGGKIGTLLTKPLTGPETLSLAYTPGVGEMVREIAAKPEIASDFTARGNLVAVVSDGTAILGLGDLGATASIPVMEGKAVLFKAFADVDGWPVPLDFCRQSGKQTGPTDIERIIDTTARLACMYGGINLEDIAAPACFEIEERLDAMLDIPVFHDDQWGTAVITLAGVFNYCLLTDRKLEDLRIVINGAGAAGIRIADMLSGAGAKQILICDSKGVIHAGRNDLTEMKRRYAVTNTAARSLTEAIRGAHLFIGVSIADCLKAEEALTMADFPGIFAMANPNPEIKPEVAIQAFGKKPYVMATGRSDYPNQINNVLGFPFLFRGALDAKASSINLPMKQAAAKALAELAREPVPETIKKRYQAPNLSFGTEYIVPTPFDRRLFAKVSSAVAEAALVSGIAGVKNLDGYASHLEKRAELLWQT